MPAAASRSRRWASVAVSPVAARALTLGMTSGLTPGRGVATNWSMIVARERLHGMSSVGPEPPVVPRPSRSADASRADELARIRAMSVRERMGLALALGRRCRTIAELAGGHPPEEG